MTEIIITEAVSVATFVNVPTNMLGIFAKAAEKGIAVDMISQIPTTSDNISFGFSFSDDDIGAILPLINSLSTANEKKIIPPMVNCGNVKLTVKSDEMIEGTGFAAKVISALSKTDCIPLLTSTGVDEISVIVRATESAEVEKNLSESF